MPVIEIKNLSKSFERYKKEPGLLGSIKGLFWRETFQKQAVKDVSFSLEEGELVGFLGPNGAGKTTLLKMLSGILHPSSGEVRVLGFTPWNRDHNYQRQFSIVMGQKNQLWWDLPARESFALNRDIYQVDPISYEKTLHELVNLLDLQELLDIQVRQLSLGERMKCELVAALLHQPRVLFLDEPTIGLDVISQERIRDFLKEYNRVKKTTVLLTSHYMRDVERLCDRVLVINYGSIVYDGRLKDLADRYVDHKIIKIQFSQPISLDGFSRYGEIVDYDPHHLVLKVKKGEVAKTTHLLLGCHPIEDLSIEEVEIEEVIGKIFNEKI